MKTLREQHSSTCTFFSLPFTSDDPNATFKDDLSACRNAISSETSRGRDVVLVAYSHGGMVANSAIRDFISSSPGQGRIIGRIIGLVFIASGFTLTGLSFMDPLFHIPPPMRRVNKVTGFAEIIKPPAQLFYHDLPAEEGKEWVAQLTPQSLKSLFEGGEYSYAGWQDVPVWDIGTIEDKGLPVVVQRAHVGMARSMGASVVHKEFRSSHSPFLSQSDEVVQLLLDAASAFAGKVAGVEALQISQGRNEVLAPAVTTGRSSTWLKYG